MLNKNLSSLSVFCEHIQWKLDITQIRDILFKSGYKIIDFERIKEESSLWEDFIAKFKINWSDVGIQEYTLFLGNLDISIDDLLNSKFNDNFFVVEWWKYSKQHSSGITEINILTNIKDDPLMLYHKQIKIISCFANLAKLVRDNNTYTVKDLERLEDVANNETPWSPRHLYMIQNIYKEIGWKKTIWMHTHWLERCWIGELEIMEVEEKYAQVMYCFLESVAAQFLEYWEAKSWEIFNIWWKVNLCILPWRDALTKIWKICIWWIADRIWHWEIKSNILLAPKKTLFGMKYKSPQSYWDKFLDEPLEFFSDKETERMRMLAKEKFENFSKLFDIYKNNEEWEFLVKIWVKMETKKYENFEHLRFLVHQINWDNITWLLLNDPYNVPSMKWWNIYTQSLDKLSWWMIRTEEFGSYDPDTVYLLWKKMFYSK